MGLAAAAAAAKSLQLCCIQSTLWTWVRWSLFIFKEKKFAFVSHVHMAKTNLFFRLLQILSTRVNKGQNLSLDLIACHIYWEEVKKPRKACDWHVVSICWYWAPSLLRKRGPSWRGQRWPLLGLVSIYLYPSAVHL